MENKEKYVFDTLISYINDNKLFNDFIFNNIELVEVLNYRSYLSLYECKINSFNNSELTKMPIMDKISFIKEFYESAFYSIDLDKIVDNGHINLMESESFCYEGYNYYEQDGFKSIDVNNNGLLIDSALIVHEVSHYNNQEDEFVSDSRSYLTEILAYCDNLLYFDYVKDKGYTKDYLAMKNLFAKNCRFCCLDNFSWLRLFLMISKCGDVSKESYSKLFCDDNYEMIIDKSFEELKKGQFRFFYNMRYVIGFPLAIYVYLKYKNNVEFIVDLHNHISDIEIADFFKKIGFDMNLENNKSFFDKLTLENKKYKEGEFDEYFSTSISR